MNKQLIAVLCLIAVVFQSSCQMAPPNAHEATTPETKRSLAKATQESLTASEAPHTFTVTTLDGKPLERAKILIGNKRGQPFANNWLETDGKGQAIAPSKWITPQSVTVQYPGFMRITYHQVQPQNLRFKLRPLAQTAQILLSGKTTHFGNLKRDNIADFGLVIQALTRGDLFSFNIDKLISPEFDKFRVGGIVEASIPSNLTFPRQQETYGLPIVLEKEKYRLFFREPGLKRSYALHGQFPFKETVDKFRNDVPFTSIINSFKFVGGGLKEFQLDGPLELNLPVNEMSFTAKESLQPPAIPPQLLMLSISLFELNGMLFPTDMRKVENEKPFFLKGIEKAQKHFLSVLTYDPNAPKREAQFQEASSVEFVAQTPNHTPQFLNLIPTPTPIGNYGWSSQTPEPTEGVTPLTTFSVLSKIIIEGNRKKIQREWEVYASAWVSSLELPEWPEDNTTTTVASQKEEIRPFADNHRWEIVYVGSNQKLPIPMQTALGPDSAELASHISFNSVEF